jgi:hypothetical protein
VAVEEGSGQPLSYSTLQLQVLPEQQLEFKRLLETPLQELMAEAAALRDQGHRCITFSPKVSRGGAMHVWDGCMLHAVHAQRSSSSAASSEL